MMDPYTYYSSEDFAPKSFVMVRNSPNERWQLSVFAYSIDVEDGGRKYVCLNGEAWNECISYIYGQQKNLLGTIEAVEGLERKLKPGQPVAVRNDQNEAWKVRRWLYSTDIVFRAGSIREGDLRHVCSKTYPLVDTMLSACINCFCKRDYRIEEWKYCLPLNLAFNSYNELAKAIFYEQ